MHPGRRGRKFGEQQLDRIVDALEFLNPQALALIQQTVLATDGPAGAIPFLNPGPGTLSRGYWYGLDAAGDYVLATGETASVIQPLFVAATEIPPGVTGWVWAPAILSEVIPDGGSFTTGAAIWLSATAGWEGTVTTTRPISETQFMVGWVQSPIPTAYGTLKAWLLMQPKRT
jgi:hypothetical protein